MAAIVNAMMAVATMTMFAGCPKTAPTNSPPASISAVESNSTDHKDGSQRASEKKNIASAQSAPVAKTPGVPVDLQIHPREGVGSLKFGMSLQDARQLLGKPDRVTGRACEYLSRGMAVVGDKNDEVFALLFGDSGLPDSPLIKACKHRTVEGIGMGSTERDITRAYGLPSVRQVQAGVIQLTYSDLDAEFVLRKGRVVHMQFRMPRDRR